MWRHWNYHIQHPNMKCTTVQFESIVKVRLFLLMFIHASTITSSEKRIHLRQKQKKYTHIQSYHMEGTDRNMFCLQ